MSVSKSVYERFKDPHEYLYGLGAVCHKAIPYMQDGEIGYLVQIENGYYWMSEDEFMQRYVPLGSDMKMTDDVVNRYFGEATRETSEAMNRTVVTTAKTRHGWEMAESSSCIDRQDYNFDVAKKNTKKRLRAHLRTLLSFMLAWAKRVPDMR